MKKLLLITDAWYPQVNGVVRTLDTTINCLEARGFKVALIHPGLFRTMPLPTYPEIRLALFPRHAVRRAIEAERPDYIHIATEGTLGWSARRLCMERGLAFTASYHTHFQLHLESRFRGLIRPMVAMLRRFHSTAAKNMVATPSLKKMLEDEGFTNLEVWPLGVDTEMFTREQVTLPAYIKKPVFVFFSRLASEKSPEEFFDLDLPGTKLVIGDGPMREELEAKYPEAVFVGYKRRHELTSWLSMGDVMVFPSRTETFGLVALEALACGVPVAAHDVMGPRDFITNGVDGYLGEDLRECALKCLKLDRTKCREKALHYTWEKSADAFIQHLMPVLA